MGGGESNKTGKEKETKTVSTSGTTQEQPSATVAAVNQDWPGFQAYSPMPPHGFMASSPQTHPYMWGVQHIMPPYGTPPHPYVMYPHGGMYAHPSIPPGSYPFSPFAIPSPNGIPEVPGNTPVTGEADTRPSDAKEKLPIKRSKGSLGSLNAITGKTTENSKIIGTPANGLYSKSAESGSEGGSSEGSDANSQNDSQNKSVGGQDSLEDTSQNGGSIHGSQNGMGTPNSIVNASMAIVPISGTATVPGPATNLNIGMDYWGPTPTHAKVSSAPIVPGGSRDGVQSQLWLQDERELKKQRRKQSNRESARRSRLRKQAECDELAQRAGALKEENDNLRLEVSRIKHEYDKLLQENASLKERIGEGANNNDQSKGNDTQQT